MIVFDVDVRQGCFRWVDIGHTRFIRAHGMILHLEGGEAGMCMAYKILVIGRQVL